MDPILQKAIVLIEEATNNDNFHFDYSDNLIATGGSSADYSAYYFELSEDYFLTLDFKDFSFDDFSIVGKSQKQLICQLLNEE